jgi:hypothetical protein
MQVRERNMNLIEMLTQAQGGQSVSSLGRQFGLDEAQTRAALEQLAPVVAAGLRRNAASDDGLVNLARELQGGQFGRYADENSEQLNDATLDGNAILAQIFGSKDVSRGVANQAADLSGVGSAILKKMLPVIAAMIIGQLTKSMTGGSSPPPRREASSGGLEDMIKDVLGGGQQSGRGSQGGGLGDILGDVLGGGQQSRTGSQGGGLGDILGDILGGGQAQAPQRREEAIRRGRETLDDVLGRGTRTGNVADDLLNSVERATRR